MSVPVPISDFNWKSDIWNIKSSPKTKLPLWKAVHDSLPVGDNLKLRNINPTAQCPFCGENETSAHLFFSCTFATQVWSLSPCSNLFDTTQICSFKEGLKAVRLMTCLPPSGIGACPLFPG